MYHSDELYLRITQTVCIEVQVATERQALKIWNLKELNIAFLNKSESAELNLELYPEVINWPKI